MSITRLQQARQMYAMGQRVGRIAFGGGGSYVSGSGAGKYQGGSGAPGSAEAGKSSYSSPSDHGGTGNDSGGYVSKTNPTGTLTGQDIRDAARDYQMGISRVGPTDNLTGYTGQAYQPLTKFGYKQYPYQNFLDYRPKVDIPNLGLSGMFLNLFNKGVNSPIQKFADFTTAKNRDYFMNEVVRAGKIDGLNFGTIKNMTGEELEAAYKGYLSDRLSGATDAYGNPLNQGGGEGANQGIAALYNYNMFDDTETENANDPFVSRFLQNQPDDIREGIESKMQNYYTV